MQSPSTMQRYPTYEEHQKAWDELAAGIASLRHEVSEQPDTNVPPNSKPGSLTIIGTGIETIGIAVGDQKLIEGADKVLYCVADPATIVWLKRLRPDALDLYVLYGDGKVRYTTYMQMTEAQLYWVRKGLKVVVIFYGHPGIFVLSTHRAIKLARREGHRAVMKAGVCALDTLCADLGVDPCHPGMQTHEATDCLVRRRHIDPSLHVVLWQVGLIGELGYRRQGYLNTNFSYFISWLQSIYGDDYPITHYIGSRYPTIDPLVDIYPLSKLHDPEVQTKITGLSTFYIPPRDVVPSDYKTAKDLGILQEGQHIVQPSSPLREIGLYGSKEMKAFDAFKEFSIPASYKWQYDTAASNFLIELRFDTALQSLYEKDPLAALDDPRFASLTDRERALLASRDSGGIQIASKGAYLRSPATEDALTGIFNHKAGTAALLKQIGSLPKREAREKLADWFSENHHEVDWGALHGSIDYVNQNNLFPWTGVYLEAEKELVVTLVGNGTERKRSIVYINDLRIRRFTYDGGIIRWKAGNGQPFNGFLRPDVDNRGRRRIMGKIWKDGEPVPSNNNFTAWEVDPERKTLAGLSTQLYTAQDASVVYGDYAVRTNGVFAKEINHFHLSADGLTINDKPVGWHTYKSGHLAWSGGSKECHAGEVELLIDPIIHTVELFGCSSMQGRGNVKCYGSSVYPQPPEYQGPPLPLWAGGHLASIVHANSKKGGLLLWHKWEKHHFTSRVVNKIISALA